MDAKGVGQLALVLQPADERKDVLKTLVATMTIAKMLTKTAELTCGFQYWISTTQLVNSAGTVTAAP